MPVGIKGYQPKELTEEEVKAIYESDLGQLKLAKQFGVRPARIGGIKRAKSLEEALEYVRPKKDSEEEDGSSKSNAKSGGPRNNLLKTENVEDANVLQVVPTVKQFSSVILFLAKTYTETEWNWPKMDVGDWIDTYLYHTLRQHGVTLGYNTQEAKNESDGGSDGG